MGMVSKESCGLRSAGARDGGLGWPKSFGAQLITSASSQQAAAGCCPLLDVCFWVDHSWLCPEIFHFEMGGVYSLSLCGGTM